MSINVHIRAERKISFKDKNGKRRSDTQSIIFNCWQTPSEVSRNIMASANPVDQYIEWVKSLAQVERIGIYADDDILCEGPIIGYDAYCAADEHIDKLKSWIAEAECDGYTVLVDAW